MGLLNYTTKIDPDKTAQEIAKCLSQHGAQAVLTEYDPEHSYVSAISFRIKIGEQLISFRLPCDWKPVCDIMYKNKRGRYSDKGYSARRDQAIRTAWRIVKDWVEAQMALVETRMARTEEVFLPYAVMRNGQTLAEHMVSDPSKLLGSGE
jgi:hypothetical protein